MTKNFNPLQALHAEWEARVGTITERERIRARDTFLKWYEKRRALEQAEREYEAGPLQEALREVRRALPKPFLWEGVPHRVGVSSSGTLYLRSGGDDWRCIVKLSREQEQALKGLRKAFAGQAKAQQRARDGRQREYEGAAGVIRVFGLLPDYIFGDDVFTPTYRNGTVFLVRRTYENWVQERQGSRER